MPFTLNSTIHRFAIVLLLGLALMIPLAGQTGDGAIQGTVKDASGASIPNCSVSITHQETSRTYSTTSNALGFYIFPSVQPGAYRIAITASGMARWEATLMLQVGQTATVDPQLGLASTSTVLNVGGDVTPLVTSESPTTGSTVERARIEQLPLNGRNVQNLIAITTPGIDSNTSNPTVYGIRYGMTFLQDGAVLGANYNGGIWSRPPGVDTVQEFRVETSVSSAKFAAPATAVLSTRSGTNSLHGSLFETARNNGFGIARAREDYYTKPPQLIRNEFGASAGGPVMLPKIYNGKNRTFFFFAWEAYRYAFAQTASTSLHTMAMRQGDFSGLVASNGRAYTLYDPWSTGTSPTYTRAPYPSNQIPLTRESPMAKYLLGVTPAPTLPAVNPLISNNYYGAVPLRNVNNTETVRIDHRLSDRDQIFGRYTHGGILNRGLRSTLPTTDNLLNTSRTPIQDNGGSFSWTHSFSPTFFSETTASVSQEDMLVGKGSTNAGYLVNSLGVPNPYSADYAAMVVRKTGFGMDYREQEMENAINRLMKFDQNFTKIIGKHELQFGGRYYMERYHVLAAQPRLTVSFQNSYATSQLDPASGSALSPAAYTGHDSANFFIGVAASYDTTLMRNWYHMKGQTAVGYFQDNFKLSSRLTLNLGVRWELYPPFTEDNNLMSGFDKTQKAVITGAPLSELYKMGVTTAKIVSEYQDVGVKFISSGEAGLPNSLIYANKWDFNPRVGFAYRTGDGHKSTILRGGYGRFGFAPNIRVFTDNMRRDIPMYAIRQNYANVSSFSADGLANANLRSTPTVIAGSNSSGVLSQELTGDTLRGAFQYTYFNPKQPTMRADEWNLTVEREILPDTVARIGYVGTHTSNLEQYIELNSPPNAYVWYTRTGKAIPTGKYANTAMNPFDSTTYGPLWEYGRIGWSNANSFRMEVERRSSKGIGFQFYYVLTNAFKTRGSDVNLDYVYPTEDYLEGAVPSDTHTRNRFMNYRRDSDIAKHRFNWNWTAELPFGHNKKFLPTAGPVLDRLVGGWQLAGMGSYYSKYFSLPTSYFGANHPLKVYGKSQPIKDCRSGACYDGYLWYNGYIAPTKINTASGVSGVPSDYSPVAQPLNSDPTSKYFGTETTTVKLADGSTVTTPLNTNLNVLQNQYALGPWTFNMDASLFKNISITERVNLRFNADFFNVFNMPGLIQPTAEGIVSKQTSYNTPRQLQLTLRLSW
jgi:hypothetical protein